MLLKLYLHLELKKKILNKGRVVLLVTTAMKLVDELLPYREDDLGDWVIFNNTSFDKKNYQIRIGDGYSPKRES